jgi:hypothetical protein
MSRNAPAWLLRIILATAPLLALFAFGCTAPVHTVDGYDNNEEAKPDAGGLPDPTPPKRDGGAPSDASTAPPPSKSDGGAAKPGQLVASAIKPKSATTTSGATPITVTGGGFVSGAKITFAGVELPTHFASATSLTATIAANQLATAGSIPVVVVNPNGGKSSPLHFTVSDGRVTLSSISPTSAAAGSAGLTLSVTGQGFSSGATVTFDGTPLSPRGSPTSTQISVDVPASLLTDPGEYSVAVDGPGGVSLPITFTVTSSTPIFSTYSPASMSTSTTSQTVSVSGRGFDSTSRVTVQECSSCQPYIAPTTLYDSTYLEADIDAYFVETAGTLTIRVYNGSGSDVQYSDAYGTIDVIDSGVDTGGGAPTLSYLSPSSANAGSDGIYVTVNGSGFDSSTTVVVGSASTTTYYESSTSVSFYVSSDDLAYDSSYPNGYSYTISVYNLVGGTQSYATATASFNVE